MGRCVKDMADKPPGLIAPCMASPRFRPFADPALPARQVPGPAAAAQHVIEGGITSCSM